MKRTKWMTMLLGAAMAANLAAPISTFAAQGWVKEQNGWVYYAEDGKPVKDQLMQIGDSTYAFDDHGYMIYGWLQNDNGFWYYFDSSGKMKTNWMHLNNKWYYFNPYTGQMAEDQWAQDKGKWYYLDEKGKMETNARIGGPLANYYVDSSGAAKTGWLKQRAGWSYYTAEALQMTDSWIPDPETGKYYYVDDTGYWTETSDTSPAKAAAPEGLTTSEEIAYIQNQPVKFLNYGWIVEVNGKFGLVKPDGTWMIEPEYMSVDLLYIGDNNQRGPNGYVANFYKDANDHFEGFSLSNVGKGPLAQGFGGTIGSVPRVRDGIVQIQDLYTKEWSTDYSSYTGKNVNYIVYNEDDADKAGKKAYYVWNADTNKLFGPNPWNSEVYARPGTDTPALLKIQCPIVLRDAFNGLFIDLSRNSGPAFVSNNTEREAKGYLSMEILDPHTGLGYTAQDGSFNILDENCDVVYSSRKGNDPTFISKASGAVDGKALVKKNGIWYLMSV